MNHAHPSTSIDSLQILDVLSGLMKGISETDRSAFKAVESLHMVQAAVQTVRAGDPEAFESLLLRPHEQIVNGLLETEIPQSWQAQFVFREYAFLDRHFCRVYEDFEGRSCCADKSSAVLEALLQHLLLGVEIVFDRTQKYTYHLPTRVLASHGDIVSYFGALMRLHAGRCDWFMACYQALSAGTALPVAPPLSGALQQNPGFNVETRSVDLS